MKKLSFLTLLFALFIRTAMAATVSGTITQAYTNTPIANEMVYILDTVHSYLDSTLTSGSGAYSFNISGSVPTSPTSTLSVYLSNAYCGQSLHNLIFYSGSSVTSNFSVCSRTAHIYGGVLGNGSSGIGFANAKVYVVAATAVNPLTGDTTITAVDSLTTASDGSFDKTYPAFPVQWGPSLRIKAVLSPSDPQYLNYLPTYYDASLLWSNAQSIWSNIGGHEIDLVMVAGSNPRGPGFIGGSVLLGANKSAAVGDPLSSRILILTKSNGAAVAYTYSDAAGHFSFPSVPIGSYNIFGDALGKSNPPLTLTLTSANNHISDVVFEENDKTFKGHLGSLSAGNTTSLGEVKVFPNPVTDFVHVGGLSAIQGEKTVVLLDVTGKEISHIVVTKDEVQIPVGVLRPGMYLLQLHTQEGLATFKVVK